MQLLLIILVISNIVLAGMVMGIVLLRPPQRADDRLIYMVQDLCSRLGEKPTRRRSAAKKEVLPEMQTAPDPPIKDGLYTDVGWKPEKLAEVPIDQEANVIGEIAGVT